MSGTKGQRPSACALMVCSIVVAAIACDASRTTVLPFAPTSQAPPTSIPPPSPTPTPPSPPPLPDGGRFTPWHGPGPELGHALPIGHTQDVAGRVESTDHACFALTWDQTGRCQHFELRAAETGELEVSLTHMLPARFEMTLFIVRPDGSWMFGGGSPVQRTRIRVEAGLTYHFVVMSYFPPQDFHLTTASQGAGTP